MIFVLAAVVVSWVLMMVCFLFLGWVSRDMEAANKLRADEELRRALMRFRVEVVPAPEPGLHVTAFRYP